MTIPHRPRGAGRRFNDEQPVTRLLDPLDPDDTRPVYIKIADRIRDAIRAGRLPQAKPIPVLEVIGRYYNVTTPTAGRATQILIREGLLRSRAATGTFVCGMPPDEEK